MSLYLGIDLGTQSVKLLAYDAERREVVAVVGSPLQMLASEDGAREQLTSWWVEGLRRCFDGLGAELRAQVRGIGVSGQQHGFVPIDAAGRSLAPVKLWCDTATEAECAEILQALGGADACIEATGNTILAGYTASKVRWLRRFRVDAYRQMQTMLLPHDYINLLLTGERYTELGDASGTGWLDVRARRWSSEVLRAIDPDRDLEACLPRLAPAESLLPLARTAAADYGLPSGVRVSVGGGDNMMAAIGTGNLTPGVLTLSLGTSGTLFACSDHPVVDPQARWAAFCSSSGGWLPLICTMNCTAATQATADMLGKSARDADQLLLGTRPGAGGIVMLPFFNGERTPNLPHARACIFGLDPSNAGAANLMRAAMEGATYGLRGGMEAFSDAGLRFERVRLTGGGSRSAIWRQMVADIFETTVEVPAQPEGAAFGAALQALWADQRSQGDARGMAEALHEHVGIEEGSACTPDPGAVEQYRAAHGRFRNFLATMCRHDQA